MSINVSVIIMLVAYTFGAITKAFITTLPNRFIPLQNLGIGIISAFICFFLKLEPNLIKSLVVCLMATMSAGGLSELIKNMKPDISLEEDVG